MTDRTLSRHSIVRYSCKIPDTRFLMQPHLHLFCQAVCSDVPDTGDYMHRLPPLTVIIAEFYKYISSVIRYGLH
jgi:hypothetical protein